MGGVVSHVDVVSRVVYGIGYYYVLGTSRTA